MFIVLHTARLVEFTKWGDLKLAECYLL